MKQPMFSSLSSDQHKLYLQLFQRFTSGPPTSSQDHKQLATFKELHAMVLREQTEYLKYLKQLALLNEADYMFIHPSLHFFFCVYNKMRLRAVSNYPPYYIMHDVLMLANNNLTNNCQFNRPTTIFETGRVSSYEEKQLDRTIGWIKMMKKKRKFMRRTIHEMQKTRPCAKRTACVRCSSCWSMRVSQILCLTYFFGSKCIYVKTLGVLMFLLHMIALMHVEVICWQNKIPDESICEMSVDVDVFMSYPALECLFDNHHPTLSKQWDLPNKNNQMYDPPILIANGKCMGVSYI
ncbi:hypothetical protein HELRODRAFT_164313 [Helobdella robusta]|uniref:Uncharacterized protein n=1 Tax=Helobdella robusta TaxID=6412 RepID=T1EV91_HELRO|nr:hypothetical protein HELRODRAFT_164313 [Helobdella robusta]ESN94466.1 hypothetical protein HELRODRAFT_164313 [Helobdella robusta]